MRFFQFMVATTLLAVCSSQLLPGYFSRKQMTDSALYRFLSAVRGGGRGHRELMSITGSGSSPPASFQSAPLPGPVFGVGRLPHGITHIPPPPKIGAFYITPPERNAPFYYAGPQHQGRRPTFLRITDMKNIRPLSLATAESTNQPQGPPPPLPVQFIQLNGPLPAASSNPLPQLPSPGVPGGLPLGPGPSGPTSSSSNAGSLQEIIAQAAQKQHASVLQKEQKAHPNAQITNSQILVPGANVGQQPIFINQFGQPFLAPAILAPGQQQAQLQHLPPHVLANGQGLAFLGPPPPPGKGSLNIQSLNSIPPQFLKANDQQQQLPLHVVNGGVQARLPPPQYPLIPQGFPPQQRLPIPLMAQQLPGGGQLLSLPPGAPQFLPGQLAILPQRGLSGPIIPSNGILGHPQLALLGNPSLQQQGKVSAAQVSSSGSSSRGKTRTRLVEKEEQPTRPLESASQIVVSSVDSNPSGPANKGQSQMTAAIMQTQMEFSEPINQ